MRDDEHSSSFADTIKVIIFWVLVILAAFFIGKWLLHLIVDTYLWCKALIIGTYINIKNFFANLWYDIEDLFIQLFLPFAPFGLVITAVAYRSSVRFSLMNLVKILRSDILTIPAI